MEQHRGQFTELNYIASPHMIPEIFFTAITMIMLWNKKNMLTNDDMIPAIFFLHQWRQFLICDPT